jgi:histidinol dehydrogenase
VQKKSIIIENYVKLSVKEIGERLQAQRMSYPSDIESAVTEIINDVRDKGDTALLEYTKRYDGEELTTGSIRVTETEIEKSLQGLSRNFSEAVDLAIHRVKEFHERDETRGVCFTDGLGNVLEKRSSPIERVGIYIPGGKACYPSTLIMTAVPAMAAGVREIAVISPPSSFEAPSPLALTIMKLERILDVYRVGGVQGVAAMAFGTRTIRKVDKIVGPGNIYVTAAKKLLYGYVDIDMVAGPSEILIISDGSVDPRLSAADLAAQAEHDEHARAFCITTSGENAREIQMALADIVAKSQRKEIIQKSLSKNGKIFVVKNIDTAVEMANIIAPEHLEIQTRHPRSLLGAIKNAGAVFLGRYSPEVLGDYIAGPSHVLPTGGTARFFSPLNVSSFIKFSSVIDISKKGFDVLGKHAAVIAEIEGLDAHAKSIYLRREED